MEDLSEEARLHDIVMVLVSDPELVDKQDVPEQSPILVYYENNIPFLYRGKLEGDLRHVLNWLIEQRNMASIEEISDGMLDEIIEENEFVAVLFTGLCSLDEDEEEMCTKVVQNLETIDTILGREISFIILIYTLVLYNLLYIYKK